MLHEAKERQKFVSDIQYLRDMQHKVDSEYQSSGDEDAQAEPRLSATSSACKTDSRLPAIDQTSVKQKHKSTMTPKKSEKAGPSKPPPGDSSEHPLFCVEYSPFCSVFAFSPVLQPNTSYCCLLLPLVPPASPAAGQDTPPHLPPAPFPPLLSPSPSSPGPVPESPATLCYFPISSPRPIETPVLCLPGPRRPSKIYLVCLLEEDSEEEGDLCRICQIAGGSLTNPLLEPCGCVGSLQFVHQECLKKWLKVKITSGADLGAVKTCEMCKQSLLVNLDDFNVTEFYQKHQQSRVQNELMNSGLYLVLLLHLYEQRFAELMRLNHNRVTRERWGSVLPC
ncbi:hypothetical protein G4228_002982 [Cervus hanglu yarkandensis]|nr:hypothetical protein G4228_002982 [Cervus hanglu yarkandensis]